jgi:ABC-type sugar transport system ATPase subunit
MLCIDDRLLLVFASLIKKPFLTLYKTYEGQNVFLGIRPTDIYLRKVQIEHDRIYTTPIMIDDHELLGASVLLKARLQHQKLLIEAPVTNIEKENIDIHIDFDKIHLFDSVSELSLSTH